MVKIYTRKGDAGRTGLFDGTDVPKDHPRVAAYGEVDELNAHLGLARAFLRESAVGDLDAALERIQRDLFALGALLADPRRDLEDGRARADGDRLRLSQDDVARLEGLIDAWEEELPPLRQFVLPSGTEAAAALHVARTVARRAERAVVGLLSEGVAARLATVYLNRLSDLLFVAARLANRRLGRDDTPW